MNFEEHLLKYLSKEEIEKLITSLNQEGTKHALILNTEKINKEDFIKEFPHIESHPFVKNCFIYNPNEYQFGKHLYHSMGVYYLFEPCSGLVSELLSPNENDILLDVAAAPGGKSIHSSLLMKNEGIIVSNEIQTQRSYILSSNVERLGRKNIIVTNNTIDDLLPLYQNTFTKIILDAPCSGSGMFRKMEAMKEDWTYDKVLSLALLQKDLICKAYSMLKPGGKMVYSTCSFSYEEDEETIKYLLETTNAKLIKIPDNNYFYQSKEKIGIHLLPYLFPGEGHYICLIEKPNEESYNSYKELSDSFNNIRKLCQISNGYIYKGNDDNFYYLNKYFPTKGLHLIRGGLKLGSLEKYGFDYDYALSHYLKSFNNILDLNYEEAKEYLYGSQVNKPCKDGIVLLTYHNIPLGFGKSNHNKVNNKYPKGLRIKIS